MKRIIILAINLVSAFSYGYAQTEEDEKQIIEQTKIALKKWLENPSFTNEVLDPTVLKQFKDSGHLENGIKEGYWIEFSLDTSLLGKTITIIVGDKQIPKTSSATLQKEFGNYTNGKRNGQWTLMRSHSTNHPFDWNIFSVTNYKNGLKNGEDIWYNTIGKTILIRHFKENVENGIGKIFNMNSPFNLQEVYYAENGKQWRIEKYYPNGELQTKFRDTIIHLKYGKFCFEYFENRKPKLNGFFENGEIQSGQWKYYYENGQPEIIMNYSNGQFDGVYKYYHDNGQLWTERVYENGKLVKVISNRTKNGKKRNPGTIKNGTGDLFLYDPDGNLKQIIEYVNGKEKTGSL